MADQPHVKQLESRPCCCSINEMAKYQIKNMARQYIDIIEEITRTKEPFRLEELRDQRDLWKFKFTSELRKKSIPYTDSGLTKLAHEIIKGTNGKPRAGEIPGWDI